MISLFTILLDSFTVLRRNFVLLYPFLFFTLLLSFLLQQTGEMPSLELKWILLLSILVLLYFTFLAGWLKMIYTAVHRWLNPPPERKGDDSPEALTLTISEPILLLREFFPGIGEFFIPFVFGGLLQLLIIAILVFVAMILVDAQGGMPPILEQLAKMSQSQAKATILSLPQAELERLTTFVLTVFGTLLAYGIFYLLTMFWAPFVITRKVGALRAYGLSLRQFFRDPWRIIGLGLFNFLLNYTLTLLLQPGAALAGTDVDPSLILWHLFSLLLSVFFSIALFMYVMRVANKDYVAPPSEGEAQA